MKFKSIKQKLIGGCAALLSLSMIFGAVPSVFTINAQAAVTGSSGSYVSGTVYSHDSRFSGYSIVNGVDVSSYQKTIDWDKAKADGIDYAFIRVAFRGYGDSGSLNSDGKYKENLTNAVKAGVKVGVYIYSQAITVEEGIEEANYILERIKGYDVSLPVVIDYEYAATGLGRLYNANLSKRQATDICLAFCETVEAAGYDAMVYANKSMLKSSLYASELSEKYQIWLANYTAKTTYGGTYQYWQYTSSGAVNGIPGKVDCNFYYTQDSDYKNIKIDHQAVTPDAMDAQFTVNVQNPGNGIVNEMGVNVYTVSGSLIGKFSDTCGYSSPKVTYTGCLADYGKNLVPQTTYRYQPFAKVGNQYYYGSYETFTTTKPRVTAAVDVSVTETNALLNITFQNPAKTIVQKAGYTVYTENGIRLGQYESYFNSTSEMLQMTGDIAAQLGIKLNSGQMYQYETYTVHDGMTDTSARQKFTTAVGTPVTGISLSKSELFFDGSKSSLPLTVIFEPANATADITWSSSNTDIATVDENGNVTAVGLGTAVITAAVEGKTATCNVTVAKLPKRIILSSAAITIHPNDIELLIAQLDPADKNAEYIWTSSDPSVVEAHPYGVITGHKKGTATIRCTLVSDTRVFAECAVTVHQPVIYHLNGGTNAVKNTTDPVVGDTVTLYDPTRSGYVFDGWYLDAAFTKQVKEFTLIKAEDSVELYAKWNEIKLTKPSIKSMNTKTGGQITAKISAVVGAEGYQYVYATDKAFSKNKKTVTSSETELVFSTKLNTRYYLKVRAYYTDSSGKKVYGAYSSVKNALSASTKPDNLSGVKASSSAKGSLTVAVSSPVKNCYGYQYVIAQDADFSVGMKYVNSRNRSHTFTGLAAGTYYVRGRTYNQDKVSGGNSYGLYTAAKKITIKSNTPAAVSAITATSEAANQMTIQVSAAVPDCYGYQYVIATDSAFKNKQYKGSKALTYVYNDLTPGNYYVKVRAYNRVSGKNVYGAYAPTVKVKVRAPLVKPEDVTGIILGNQTAGQLHVLLAKPVSECTGYRYEVAADESFANAFVVDTAEEFYTFKDLTPGSYYVRVCAYNSAYGETLYGGYSPVMTVTVKTPIETPDDLTGMKAEAAGKGELKVMVAAPVIACYGYQYQIAFDEAFTMPISIDTRLRSHLFTKLPKGTWYIRGRTYNQSADGSEKLYGTFTPTVTFTIESDIPECLTGVKAESAGSGKLKVSVAAPVISCYGYRYIIATDEAFSDAVAVDTRQRSHTFTDLKKGTYYIKGCTYDQTSKGVKTYGTFCPTITFEVK